MLLALRGRFAIIPEPARPELRENIIDRTACEAPKYDSVSVILDLAVVPFEALPGTIRSSCSARSPQAIFLLYVGTRTERTSRFEACAVVGACQMRQ
jgi:hypothetical protein